ncbi:fluoride efflux transporter CrcB [Halovenus sp. WSH3]|uniref:Fluoride-specific ion channel FluC n=1 Tax=Halovenus carboxidivorans TaxID=2692199 RepID=A0A6B0T8K7_9EURY|nr:fluoride efflux transporter CrcB [Halovenus carboxidivorans]MXR51662.1 fluoride efflux transporter CrcB [Halovenus carboxidivorans]
MRIPPAQLVGAGGAIGAVLRYLVGQYVPSERFPFATLLINVVGSFALGLVMFVPVPTDTALFVGVGACGAFTTYSSFSVETVRLWESGSPIRAGLYAAGTFLSCALAVGVAWALAAVIW